MCSESGRSKKNQQISYMDEHTAVNSIFRLGEGQVTSLSEGHSYVTNTTVECRRIEGIIGLTGYTGPHNTTHLCSIVQFIFLIDCRLKNTYHYQNTFEVSYVKSF